MEHKLCCHLVINVLQGLSILLCVNYEVCPRCARFIAATLRGQPFLTHVSRCIYRAGLVNVIIMCPLCTVECLARRPSLSLSHLLQWMGFFSLPEVSQPCGERQREIDAILVHCRWWDDFWCSFLLPRNPLPCVTAMMKVWRRLWHNLSVFSCLHRCTCERHRDAITAVLRTDTYYAYAHIQTIEGGH